VDKVVVTTICSAGVVFACALVIAWRATTVSPVASSNLDEPISARLVGGLRLAAAVAAAGVGGGLLTFGLGGRLMMRVLAATSPDAQGFLTEAEERVGEVTSGGTVGFVIFVGVAALVPAGVYMLLRRWLPKRSVVAGLVGAGIGGGLLVRPSGLVDPGNRDFDILSPTWLAVVLCVAVVTLGSVTIAVLADRFVATWPELGPSPRGVAASLPLAVYAVPPLTVVGVVLVAFHVLATRPGRRLRRTDSGASVVPLSLAAIFGGGWVVFSAIEILT
jgi:hypothetical protein